MKEDAIIHFRTFYDKVAGHRKFGHLRKSLAWRNRDKLPSFERTSRRETSHLAWCKGYELKPLLQQAA